MAQNALARQSEERHPTRPWREPDWTPDDNDDDERYTSGWDDPSPTFGLIRPIPVPFAAVNTDGTSGRFPAVVPPAVTHVISGAQAAVLLKKLSTLAPESLDRIEHLDTVVIDAVLAQPLELDDDPVDIDLYLGPWTTSGDAQTLLGVNRDALNAAVERWELLGLRFNDGELYFPSRQFDDGAPLPGLAKVIALLQPALETPQSIALWLTGVVEDGDMDSPLTVWDLLRTGQLDEVLTIAEDDLADWEM